MERRRHSREYWERLVELFEQGDETTTTFANAHRVRVSTFRSWLYRIRREREEAVPPAMAFVEVVPLDPPADPVPGSCVWLELPGGCAVHLAELPAPEYLAALSRELSQ
jgi:transposase-like protein